MLTCPTADQLIATWVQVGAVDIILGEVAAELGGVDPVKPDVRENLDGTQRKLQPATT